MFDKSTVLLLMIGCIAVAWVCWYGVTWYLERREREELEIAEALKRNRVAASALSAGDLYVPDSSPAARSRSANAVGIGYASPAFDPAPGYFWKQDANNGKWRLYRTHEGAGKINFRRSEQ